MKKQFTRLIGAFSVSIFLLLFSATGAFSQYCSSASTNTTDEWLSNVNFAGIDNASGSTTYSDFTSISGTVVPGSTYTFTGTISQTGTYTETVTVYIDWDQSQTFEASEKYSIGSCSTDGCDVTADIEVPMSAIPGETRMRVIQKYYSEPTSACGSFTYGEVEDYTLNVNSGVCTPPSFDYEVVNNCPAETYKVTATLNDFGSSPFITISFTRSDAVPVNSVTLPMALQGQTVNLITNVPFGVTVDAVISGTNPVCDLTRHWEEEYCHIDGEVCEAPIVVSSLPFTVDSANTADFLDDYSSTDVPPVSPNAITNGSSGTYYLNGDEVVYAYTPSVDQAIDINLSNTGTYAGLWVFTGCPFDSTMGYDNQYPAGNRAVLHLPVTAGTTYYIVISTWASPQNTPYSLSITEYANCTGTPSAGTVGSGMMVCSLTSFDLEATGVSEPANGLTFVWQSSPAGQNTWTDIEGANSNPYTVDGVSEDTDFRLKAYCSFSDETSYSNVYAVTINPNYLECYCIPEYSTGCSVGDLISNVTLNGETTSIDNTTDCSENDYSDYSDSLSADLAPGETYTLTVATTYGSPQYEDVKAWIDYNLDGAFGEDEEIANTFGDGLPGGSKNFTFVVPENLASGDYRLRVRMVYSNETFTACSDQTYGETEDYNVNIIDLDACSGTPEAGTEIDDFSVCANIPFEISVTGASDPAEGLSRIWQSSPAGQNVWTDIDGATSPVYTVSSGIAEPMDYRYLVACSNSQQSDESGVIAVSLNPAIECYCIPSNTYSQNYYISNVTTDGAVQDINKSSGFGTDGYSDYSGTDTLIVYAGQEFDISLTYAGNGYTYTLGIWVDLNQNGSFEAEEKIVSSGYSSGFSGSITIPDSLEDGSYRVRVRADYIGTAQPCGDDNYAEAEDYTLSVITLDECAGTPEGGDAGSDFTVCAGNDFMLSVTGASSPANGLDRIWQSSPAGAGNWTDITDANSPNYTLSGGITEPTDFRYRVTCTNSGQTDYSNVVSVTLNPGVQCYCTPAYNYDCSSGDDISNVTLEGESVIINNTTDCSENGYGDYTSMAAPDLAPGNSYTLSVSTSYGSPTSEEAKAWIDFNENGAFEASEEIGNTAGAGLPGGTASFEFTVPEGTTAGTYRLRVRLVYYSEDFDACNFENYGETEDYMVSIIQLTACSGTPEAGSAANDALEICADQPFTVSVTGASEPADGLTKNWQISTDGGATWTDIAGATSATYTSPGITVESQFRYRATCVNSNETDYSNVITTSFKPANECYCIPEGTNSNRYIDTLVTTDGIQNISNLGSGFSEGGYGDFTNLTVEQNAGDSVFFSASFVGGTFGFRVWVDWNQDGAFDTETEVAWNSSGYQSAHSGYIVVPAGATPGTTRMRVVAHWLSTTGNIDPCATGFTYGEFEDYTFVVSGGGAAQLNGTLNWNSNCGDRDGTVKLYEPGTATLVASYNITVSANGTFNVPSVELGTFDVIVKVQGYLAKGVQDVEFTSGGNSLALGAIVGGDVNGDNFVSIIDASFVNNSFGSATGGTNYNPLTDLDCNGFVNIVDFSLLNASFGQAGATAPLN